MSTPSPCTLSGGGFQDSEGNVLANGALHFLLSQDGSVSGVGNICSGIEVIIQLDDDGNAVSGSEIWGNDVISPTNSFYRVTGYSATGQPSWGPNNQQVTGSTFDLGTWVPNQIISWVPSIQATDLEVNGTPNIDQALLNLTAGTNITITDEGAGEVVIAAAGSSSSPVGSNVIPMPLLNPATNSAGLNGYTVVLRIPNTYITAVGTSVKIGILTTATLPFVVNAASIGATLPGSTTWTTSPVAVTWPGGAFGSESTLYLSNVADITIDTAHDYYIAVYIDSSSSGGDAYFTTSTATGDTWQSYQGLSGYLSGNHSNDANASSLQSPTTTNIFVISQVVIG
jgi:hypothetical protein